ncbi:hypothetical protein FACS1894182_08800 [Bacteroidia bacterium]|nr:hypothetical protein FACS1894182_08800 [Bacteroidia bacterium]
MKFIINKNTDMKNKYITALYKSLLFLSCILLVAACTNSDLDTNQLTSSEVLLRSFGPSPIARGAELRIIGTNLDKVESVTIPGAPAITDIKRISTTEIRVTVPQSATIGRLILKAGGKTITSITDLTYSEPISIDKITPMSVKAGSIIKIEGEYLNLIQEIIFFDDVHVLQADFVSQSRSAIEVVVPITAQTGKMIVSDGADIVYPEGEEPGIPIWVYSDEDLTVTLPAISKLDPQPVKPGAQLTISGTDFDLVQEIRFGENNLLSEFTVNTAKTEIKVTVPRAMEGDELKLIAFSGVEIVKELKLVAPAITGIAPNPAKNKGVLTITGTDLDLVTSIDFTGGTGATIESQSATSIEVTVPATAVDGNLVLNTHSGQTAETAYTLVKPTITNVAPLSITAGDNITITGTNLDLVNEVIFQSGTGTASVYLTVASSATSITIRSPFTATSGTIGLKTENGTVVNSTQSLTVAPAILPVILEIARSIKPGGLLTIKGVNLETVTAIGFVYAGGTEIAATRFMPDAEGTTLQVYAPATKGDANVRLYAGAEYVESGILTIGTYDPVWDEAYVFFDFNTTAKNSWWGQVNVNNVSGSYWDGVENDPSLSLDGTPYAHVNNGSGIFFRNSASNLNLEGVTLDGWVVKFDIRVMSGSGAIRLELQSATDNVQYMAVVSGLVDKGDWYTVSVPFSDFKDNYGSGTNSLPDLNINEFGATDGGNGNTMTMLIDNVRFEPK